MNNTNPVQPIQDQVLAAITSGRVLMRPRWHFVLTTILSILGLIIGVLTSIYLISFILFTLRYTGTSAVPVFGIYGWYAFVRALPWVLILLLVLFIGVLEVLVRRYAFSYRRPLLYSAIAIVVFVVLAGYIVAVTPLHGRISRYAEHHALPVAGSMYRHYGRPPASDIHVGDIVIFTNNGFLLHTRRNEQLTVVVTRKTRLPFGDDFDVNDRVVVFGERHGGTVEAYGVREVEREE